MINIKHCGQLALIRSNASAALIPPASGRDRALEVLGLRAVAYTNGQYHTLPVTKTIPVAYRRPRTQFVTLTADTFAH